MPEIPKSSLETQRRRPARPEPSQPERPAPSFPKVELDDDDLYSNMPCTD